MVSKRIYVGIYAQSKMAQKSKVIILIQNKNSLI